MKLFIYKLIAIIAPVVLFFVFPLYVEYVSGELVPLQTVITRQSERTKDIIFGLAYSDQSLYYKIEMVKRVQPDVMALGNSKVLTMRQEFFKPNVIFYNAGGTAGDIVSFRRFLELSSTTPKVIFMTVEPLHFDPLLDVRTMGKRPYESTPYLSRALSIVSQSFTKVYSDYFDHKYVVSDLKDTGSIPETIGLNARVTGSGTRNDGSYHYGKQFEDTAIRDEKIQRAVTFITTKTSIPHKESFSKDALAELDRFLAYCESHDIYVIGYIPPTPKPIEEAYRKDKQYSYIWRTYDETLPVFQKHHFALYDFFTLSSLGANEDETIDEYHTSEKVMVRTLINIAKRDKKVAEIISPNLPKILGEAKDQNDVVAR